MPKPNLPNWFVYIVRCADRSLYTGVTTDLPRRLRQHNAGTASRVYAFPAAGRTGLSGERRARGAALQREVAIKRLSRSAKEQLIARRGHARSNRLFPGCQVLDRAISWVPVEEARLTLLSKVHWG